MSPVERLMTNACIDGLHSWCEGDYEGIMGGSAATTGQCGCECHIDNHILDEDCWCDPYRDTQEPTVLIHRKAGAA